jgi:zinc-ribbon domain
VTLSASFFVVVILPMLALIGVMYVVMFTTMMSQQNSRGAPHMPLATLLFFYAGIFGWIIVMLPLTVLLTGGAYRAAFKQLRGGQVEFRDLFSARDCYWRLLGAMLLQMALGAVGVMLCVVPAFIVGGLLLFTQPLIIERNMGVFEAMRASRDLTQPRLLMFVLFAFLVQLIGSAGSYLCYIGLLATWPLMFTIGAVAFRDCFGVEGAVSFSQPPAPQQPGYGAVSAVEPPPVEQQTVVCPNCQASLPATAQFCFHCGTSIGAR